MRILLSYNKHFVIMTMAILYVCVGDISGQTSQSDYPIVKVQGRELLVDFDRDQRYLPYLIKGVAYQPTAIGTHVYFPNDPNIYERDFALLRDMHCNTIRTWGRVNTTLMDYAEKYGIKVIAGFKPYSDSDEMSDPKTTDVIKKKFEDYVNQFHDHPALLFWAVGNEDNFHYKGKHIKDFYKLMNELAGMAHSIEGKSAHPVAIVNGYLINIGQKISHADDVSLNHIDIWGMNIYTGYSFDRVDGSNAFDSYAKLSQKPLWISEYGIDAWDHINKTEHQEKQSEWVGHNWDEIELAEVCIGATVMAYSDEWWKGGSSSQHDYGGYSTKDWPFLHPDDFSNEEWWGMVAIEKRQNNIDRVIPRKVYYNMKEKWGQKKMDRMGSALGL